MIRGSTPVHGADLGHPVSLIEPVFHTEYRGTSALRTRSWYNSCSRLIRYCLLHGSLCSAKVAAVLLPRSLQYRAVHQKISMHTVQVATARIGPSQYTTPETTGCGCNTPLQKQEVVGDQLIGVHAHPAKRAHGHTTWCTTCLEHIKEERTLREALSLNTHMRCCLWGSCTYRGGQVQCCSAGVAWSNQRRGSGL